MQRLKLKRLCSLILVGLLFFDVLPAYALTGEQLAKLVAADGDRIDYFGRSVAVSGDTLIVGAPGDDDLADGAGAAYVYVRNGASWTIQAKLLADDGALGLNAAFGGAVALIGDTALIGAWLEGRSTGSAYVFVRNGTRWTQQARLVANDAAEGDQFGFALALSADTALIGAPLDDDMGENAGSAYVYVRNGTVWSFQEKLLAEDGGTTHLFGRSVAISADTALVGTSNANAAYVFVRNGSSWGLQDKLRANNGAGGSFGRSVALSGDTALIGAPLDDDLASNSGAAYVVRRIGTTWGFQDKLLADDGAADEEFGDSVALSGGTAVIGAAQFSANSTNTGSAYVFVNSGSGWTQRVKLTADDGEIGDDFGHSVAISGGETVIGADSDNSSLGDKSGSAYVFSVERFNDVTPDYWAFSFIETLAADGITAGCGDDNYCPTSPVTRAQMAVFLERGMNGNTFQPPAARGGVFLDVARVDFAANFIEQLFADGITAGCGGGNYCPDTTVTRAQMAVFLLRAKYGSSYSPPAATGVFGDAPLGSFAVDWIEQLAGEAITAGCGNGNYCPDATVTRDQMAVFLARTFSLPSDFRSGTATLDSGTGYDFSMESSGNATHGDFYFVGQSRPQLLLQGIVDVGVTSGPLPKVRIPTKQTYERFGVPVILGHTYVAKAATNEPENYIFFRVVAVTATKVSLDWVYLSR